ncbi:hypothetical protein D9611_003512 [Ephemerocybe angulata]|uniref:Uncharacterized protein n=1 Tax=Ephemerocybe angulata TaxID=980116 RepID=A0A8H5B6B3_9AGAR|nr:hypothetical protein D9611_003512 [Tulosesus angulatus]
MAALPASSRSAQNVTIPEIVELFNEKYLDTLLPPAIDADYDLVASPSEGTTVVEAPTNPLIDALKATTNQTLTENQAPALASTLSATLDAFNTVNHQASGEVIKTHLSAAWEEDPALTLRIIWCLRSIPDGKGNREGFYKAFAWLYENHPRTAIANLRHLAEPKEGEAAHGYWKDLLNILALATVDELSPDVEKFNFLHPPRQPKDPKSARSKKRNEETKETGTGDAKKESNVAEHTERNAQRRKEAQKKRAEGLASAHATLTSKLAQPKYLALYITVVRLFGERLLRDLAVIEQLKTLSPDQDRLAVLKTISLAGKWAPTPACSHDRVTNLSSAIALYLCHAKPASLQFPQSFEGPVDTKERFITLRQFLGRSVLKPLRELIDCPEPLMAANRWDKIRYARVASTAMKKNTEHFFKHDPEGFQKYLIDVESGKKKISGATLFPHEIISQLLEHTEVTSDKTSKYPAVAEFKKTLAETQQRVAEGQWKTLIAKLKESGSIENSIAICDVSGSMGYISSPASRDNPSPIHVSVALSLVLASIASPPFNGGFITFSESPQYITLDLEKKSLVENVHNMVGSNWGMNTDLNAVFMKLLLPLAKANNIKQEDMIKRLFIFSDMQFDQASSQGKNMGKWETNYDKIEKAYKKAGYEVPQIVYWDLASAPGRTVEVTATRKGVAMMNGFSSSLLKVFMGEKEETASEWEEVNEEGEVVKTVKVEDEFNPVNVMKKALLKESFAGLKVLD